MSLLRRLALHRPELRAWALYDWANSAFVTIVISAVFPVYFATVANRSTFESAPHLATERLSYTTAIALSFVALLAPILGALADRVAVKKHLLGVFMALGAGSTIAMFGLGPDSWLLACVLFALANIGAMASFVFYDSLLPHIASDDEVDRVSTAGYALGYVSGALVLVACLVIVKNPQFFGLGDAEVATRICFVIVGVWWLVFSIPLFTKVPEPPVVSKPARSSGLLRATFKQLGETLRELRKYREAALFLLAFLLYNDGIGTIIKFAVIYGAKLKIDSSAMVIAIVLVQLIGIPFTFLFGQVARGLTAKKAIYVGLLVYTLVSVVGFFMTSTTHFFILAALIGMVQGGVQALSRSLFASMIPKEKSSEFFGLFAVFEKFAGILGPLLFGIVITFAGTSRPAILAVIGFFVAGGYLLTKVDVDRGRAQAKAQ